MGLKDEMKNSFPKEIDFPDELSALCDWAEKSNKKLRTNISAGFVLKVNDDAIKYWFGSDSAVKNLGVFAHDYDGSLYAIWKDDNGTQRVVFLGSEGEPLWILSDNFVDFLRLLAIGYDEIGFSDLTKPPKENCADEDFKNWVQATFKVDIPQTGDSIVNTRDSNFETWVNKKLNGN